MIALLDAMMTAKKSISDSGWDCFDAVNSLAVVSAHLQDFKEENPDRQSCIDECVRIIEHIDPATCSACSLRAALIALEGRIEAVLRN
jgi:hypothetical protein